MTWSRIKPRQQVHGAAHTKARKQWAARHDPADLCYRCGYTLGPMGPWLHLDHDDYDKTLYRGFSHKTCNLRAAGQLGRARQKGQATPALIRSSFAPHLCQTCGCERTALSRFCSMECRVEMNTRGS